MKPFSLELLGPPRLNSLHGEPVLTSGIPLAILAYLSLEERTFTRDHLSALFWPGVERQRRLHSLRQALLHIRNGNRAGLIEGDGTLGIGVGTLQTDVDRFREHIAAGRIAEGIGLWRGHFLEGFRRPESWELEDWIDRKRSMLEETLSTAVVGEVRRLLEAGSPENALSLVTGPSRLLPYHEELGALKVIALAGVGRVAEGEGLLAALDLDEESELREEVAEALASAPKTPPPPPVPEGPRSAAVSSEDARESLPETEPAPPPSPRPRSPRLRWAYTWVIPLTAVLLLSLGLYRRVSPEASPNMAAEQAGYALLLATGWATGDTLAQLYRMGFDGEDKVRISEEEIREGVWVPAAEATFACMPDSEGVYRLFRLEADPHNPLAEWRSTLVESTGHLRDPRITRSNSKIGAGDVLVFSAEEEGGNRDIYGLSTGSGSLRRLTGDEALDDEPSVEAGGERVLFTSFRSGGGDLYSVKLDGTGLTRITDDPLRDGAAWVRNDSVLFVRGRGVGAESGNMELILLNLATGTERRLTDNSWNDYEQMWSPDGRYICWQSERRGHYESDIMVMDLKTGRSWDPADAPGRESDCRWGPVGNALLYLRWVEGKAEDLYIQDLRGGTPLNISRYPGGEAVVDYIKLPEEMR